MNRRAGTPRGRGRRLPHAGGGDPAIVGGPGGAPFAALPLSVVPAGHKVREYLAGCTGFTDAARSGGVPVLLLGPCPAGVPAPYYSARAAAEFTRRAEEAFRARLAAEAEAARRRRDAEADLERRRWEASPEGQAELLRRRVAELEARVAAAAP